MKEIERLRSLHISKRLKDLEARTSDIKLYHGLVIMLLQDRYGGKEARRMLEQMTEGED